MTDWQRLAGEGIQPRPMREKEMNNRERAKQLLGYRIDVAGSQAAKDQLLIEAIERALDEAEKRGAAGKINSNEAETMYRQLLGEAKRISKIEGQREMRERAVALTNKTYRHDHFKEDCIICGMSDSFAKAIRALPFEGE